jgi:hypothetical protein
LQKLAYLGPHKESNHPQLLEPTLPAGTLCLDRQENG